MWLRMVETMRGRQLADMALDLGVAVTAALLVAQTLRCLFDAI
jgi:hypothetical protein